MRWRVRLIRDARESAPGDKKPVLSFAQPGMLSLFGLGFVAVGVDCLWQGQIAAMSSRAGSDRPSRGEGDGSAGKGGPAKVQKNR